MTTLTVLDGAGVIQHLGVGSDPATSSLINNVGSGLSITNPTSTLVLPATTTAYAAGQTIGSAGSFFTVPNAAGGFSLNRVRLSTSDHTSTGWGGRNVQIDLWSAAPTISADRTAFYVTAGNGTHLATFSGTLSAVGGDGAYCECSLVQGNTAAIRLASGTSVFWTMQAIGGSGVTAASSLFTLTAELSN